MKQTEELLPYTLVASKSRFHPHENPLFAYLVDHYQQKRCDEIETNSGFERMVEWEKDGRKALFFHLAFVPVDFPIFQDFGLTDLHLSVDCKLVDTDSIPHRKLPPHHVSLVYINRKTEQKITVRIEYTKRANLVYATLRHLDGSSKESLQLTTIQKEYLLLQAISSQQLLQSFLQANQQAQYQLLLEVQDLDKQLRGDDINTTSILLSLIERLTKYARYSGCWDGRIDMCQSYLDKLHTVELPIPMQGSSEQDTSEPVDAELSVRASPQKQAPIAWEERIVMHIDTWLTQAPLDVLDSTAVSAWIRTHITNFAVLDELCLSHFMDAPTFSAQPFIQAQWQRLPTRGTLLEYFTQHLFLGHSELVRDIAPLLNDTIELYQIYMRFLHAIEQEIELRTQRIATAHVLYDSSPLYKNVLMSKRYTLLDDGEHLRGILVDLFLQDNFDVFCMYVDQGMASDTGLQLLLPGIPYHAIGAIISLFYSNPRPTAYIEKLFSRQSNIILPHIENLDLSLYQIEGKKIIRHKANTYLIERNHRKKKIELSNMCQHSSITTLRITLDKYEEGAIRLMPPARLSQLDELLTILAQHSSPELLIKETMKFFDNHFFVTSYGAPYQRSVHPEVMMAKTMDELIALYRESSLPREQSVRLLIGVVFDNARKKSFADIMRNGGQNLLTKCLATFNSCSLEEQTTIVRNLFRLILAGLRTKQSKECIFLMRALIFCCLSVADPTIEIHYTLLSAIFLFGTARGDMPELQMISPMLKTMADNYVKGLPESARVLLNQKNLSLMRYIMSEASPQTFFNSTSKSNGLTVQTSITTQDEKETIRPT